MGVFWPVLAQIFPAYSVAVPTIYIKVFAGLGFLLFQCSSQSQIWSWSGKGSLVFTRVASKPFEAAQIVAFRIPIHLNFLEKCIRDREGEQGLASSLQRVAVQLGRRHRFSKKETNRRKRLLLRWDSKWSLKKQVKGRHLWLGKQLQETLELPSVQQGHIVCMHCIYVVTCQAKGRSLFFFPGGDGERLSQFLKNWLEYAISTL